MTDRNEAPTKTDDDIPDQRILVGLTLCPIDADDHFMDPDHRDQQAGLLIDVSSTRPGDAEVNVGSGNEICIKGRNVGSGPSRVRITASDREGLSVFKTFLVTVEHNMPPMVAGDGIADQTAQEGGRMMDDLHLDYFFDDGDATYDEHLTYAVSVADSTIATPALRGTGNELRVYGDTKGLTDVTVTATDQNGQSVSDTFEIQVVRNYSPMADNDAIGHQQQYIGKVYDPIDATMSFTDEGDELTYDITTSNPDVATTAIKYDEMGGPWIVIHLHMPGTVEVTMTATDSARQTATVSFELVVHPRNDPPTIANAIPDVEIIELRSMDVMLADVFMDDHDALEVEVVNEDEGVADVVYRMRENLIRIYANEPGMTTVTVTATDDFPADQPHGPQMVVDEFTIVVVPNHPPVVANAIGPQQMFVNRTKEISLAGVFADENDDPLTLVAESLNEEVATVELSMASGDVGADGHADDYVLIINGLSIGTATIAITATDPGDLYVQELFELSVESDSPFVAMELDDVSLTVVEPVVVSLEGVFGDPEDEDLVLTAMSSDETVATVAVEGTSLTVTGVMVGMSTVTVTATDPYDNTAHTTFEVTVMNAAPMLVNEIDDQSMTVVEPVMVSIANTFMDPDGDELTYSAMSADELVATVGIEGTILTVTAVKRGMTSVTVTASDPDGLSASDTFDVDVLNAASMVVNEIADQTMTVVDPVTISIADTFEDPDGDELTYTAMSSDEDVATVKLYGTDLTVTAQMRGMAYVTVTATDEGGLSSSDIFKVEVINAAPMVAQEIDDQVMTVVDPVMISIADTFMDPDGDDLSYSVMSSDESVATVSLEDTDLTVTAMMRGMAYVTVTASDPDGLSVSDTFMVEVINAAPMVANEIDDQVMTVVDPVMISIADTFMDPDGDELSYTVMSSDETVATASIAGTMVTVTALMRGITHVTVTADDGHGLSVTDTFMVEVINAAPMVMNEIDDQTMTVVEPALISIDDTFMDPDGDELSYSVMSSDETVATASVSGMMVTVTALMRGMTQVTVTASDPFGLSVSDTFDVNVINAAPMMVGTLDSQVVTRGEPVTVSIAGVFTDPDGDPLSYSTASDDASIATASISGESMTVDGLAPGTTSITVTASDPMGLSASGSFEVTVETVPEAVGTIADVALQIGGDSLVMGIAQYFEDDDGDALTYTVSASGNAATASIAGSDMTLVPFTRGSSGITITASDPKGRSATQSFTANVSDSELKAVAEMALAHHGRAILSAVSAAFGSRLEGDRANSGLSFGRFSQYLPLKAGEVPSNVNTALSAGGSTYRDVSSIDWTSSTSGMRTPQQSTTGSGSLPNLASFLDPQNFRSFSHTLNGNGGVNSWSVWGGFDTQTFEGEGYEGDATSLFLGVDLQTHVCWLFGVAIASNTGESDYTWGSATQTMETSLTTILPYVRYEPTTGDTSVWGVVGSGSGEAESTVVNAANQTSDLSLTLGLGGLRHDFGEAGNFNLAVRADVGFANIETASGDGAIDGLSAGVNRLRAGIEASLDVDPGNGGSLTPFGELAVRNDGGDGVTGTGLEVAGGIRFSQDAFSFEARGRVTATHGGEDFSEQGISVVAAFRPAADGSGLSLSVEPRWGQTTSATQSFVWNETATIGVGSVVPEANVLRNDNGKSIDTVLGYGFRVGGDRYMLRPFVDVRSGSLNGKTTLLGAELKNLVPGPFAIETRFVFGKADIGSTKQNQIGLDARIVF